MTAPMAEAWRAGPGTTWRDRAPAMLRDTLTGPRGEPCFTSTDRRWLWRLETELAIRAPMGSSLAKLGADLTEYLRETCEHHWHEYAAEEGIAAHRQCLWCNDVEWRDEPGAVA